MNNTHTIQIEGLPEGWEVVAYRVPVKDVDMILDRSGNVNNCTWNGETAYIIVQKSKPSRIVLEETEKDSDPSKWQRFEIGNYPIFVECGKILREIKEE